MQPIEHKTEPVGKFIGNTKIKHTWIFRIYQKTHTVDFYESKFSGNFRVVLDEKSELYNGVYSGGTKEFVFDFDINGVNLQIRPFGNGFELFCQGKSFSYLQKNPIGEQPRMSYSDPQYLKKASNSSGSDPNGEALLQGLLQNGLQRNLNSINHRNTNDFRQRQNSNTDNFSPLPHANSQNGYQNAYSGFEQQVPQPMTPQVPQGGYMNPPYNPAYNPGFSPGIPVAGQNYTPAPVLDPYAMLGIPNPNQPQQKLSQNFPAPYRTPYPNLSGIRIVETCALERRGDYFMQIDFPEMMAKTEGIYKAVYNLQ